GRVLVEDGAAEVRLGPLEAGAGARDGAGERRALGVRHAPEVDGHRERGDLAVAHGAVDDAVDELGEVGVAQGFAVSLAADQVGGSPHTPSSTSAHSSSI